MWLRDYHFDGLRIDAVHAILDTSTVHFLEQLGEQVKVLKARLGRHLALIPESALNNPRLLQAREAGGYGLDAQWSDDFHHALHTVLTGERNGYYADFGTLAQLAKALRQAYVYDGCYSRHRRRSHGRTPTGLTGHRFLGYLQNHDQVGNRAIGHRSSHLMSTGRLKIGAALVFTSPFVPLLFQGEEWGASTPFQYFTDHEDPQLGEAVRKGRRSEFADFGWKPEEIPDPQSIETFERSRLDWSELCREPHADLLAWHHRLIALRKQTADLTDGRMDRVESRFDEQSRWLTVRRGAVTVCCNLARREQVISLPPVGARTLLLCSDEAIRGDADGILLPADSVAVLGPPELAPA
jgi:maltooligosyltrehalose trehalohydrolase